MFDGQISDEFVRYTVMNNPNFNSLTYNPAVAGRWSGQVSMLSGLDATNAKLTPFMRHGGKLLMGHGTVDQTVSTRASEVYYERMLVTMGFGSVASFARFYEIPGLQHAVGTEFNASWDSYDAGNLGRARHAARASGGHRYRWRAGTYASARRSLAVGRRTALPIDELMP